MTSTPPHIVAPPRVVAAPARARAPDGARLAVVVAANAPRSCVTCGDVLEPPWWMTTFPHGEHERCRDWAGRPFPFARHEHLLRRIARHIDEPRRREVLAAAQALAKLARTWPRDAVAILDASRMHIARVREHVQGAPHKLTAQL